MFRLVWEVSFVYIQPELRANFYTLENTSITDAASQTAGTESTSQPTDDALLDQSGLSTAKPEKKGRKKPGSRRGTETLFRVNYNNHIQLSQLADGKANMLISINGLIISVLIALIGPRINDFYWTMLPVLILMVGCMTSLAFAVFASRPRMNKTPINLEEVRRNKGNILFFGQFTRLSLTEFEEGMHEIMFDRNLLYDNMIRDLYSMGTVLRKKYYYLQFAYAVFLMTLFSSVASFLAIFFSAAS